MVILVTIVTASAPPASGSRRPVPHD